MPADPLLELYGRGARLCPCANDQITLVFSQEYPFDLVELEQLLEAVGWSRRPIRRVRKALSHSLLKVGLWRHDPRGLVWWDLRAAPGMVFSKPPSGTWPCIPFTRAMVWASR